MIFAINFVFSLYYLLFILKAMLPWLTRERIELVDKLTDPILNPIKLGLPPEKIGMDASPFIAIILFWLIQKGLMLVLGSNL
mgnify:CR=1 FL=1